MEVREQNVKERNTLRVRVTVPAAELPKVIGPIYGEIAAYMQRQGIPFAGPPFALYHNMDMNALDVEIGFPVPAPCKPSGRIEPGVLPGGRAVTAIHTGPYATLEKTYAEVMRYIGEKGIEVTPWMYETYLNSPVDTPPEALQTEIFFPVAGKASS